MRQLKVGTADTSVVVRIVDSTDGTPEQAVTSATAGLALWYRRTGGTLQAIAGLSDLGALDAAHTDGGLLHIDDGYYRVDVPDAAFLAGADEVHIGGAATNMVVIACGVQLVGYNPRTELTTAVLANLDAAVSTRSTYAGGAVASVTAGVTVTTNNDKTGYRLSATGVDDVLDEVIEGTLTLRQIQRLQLAVMAGKASGGGTVTVRYRDLADLLDRVVLTVDALGNRSASVLNGA